MIKKMASVKSTSSNKMYVLSLDYVTMQWQCSCPGWTRRMPRIECRHIQTLKLVAAGLGKDSSVVWTEEGKKWLDKQRTPTVLDPNTFEVVQAKKTVREIFRKAAEATTVKKPSKKPIKPKIENTTSSRFANLEWDDEE